MYHRLKRVYIQSVPYHLRKKIRRGKRDKVPIRNQRNEPEVLKNNDDQEEIMKINEDVTLDLSTQQSEPYRASPS
jgi:hypothetical protein